jgi:hypothetical protein
MTESSQRIFFRKVRFTFDRQTVGIAAALKKKYRATAEQLLQMRNLSVLYSQVWPSISKRLPEEEAQKIEKGFIEGGCDDDFLPLLQARPSRVSLSMLRSQKEQAQRLERQKQDLIHNELNEQREAVQAAQWAYFCTALEQDQSTLSSISQVPAKVKAKLHAKTLARRQHQAEAGKKAVTGYQDRLQLQVDNFLSSFGFNRRNSTCWVLQIDDDMIMLYSPEESYTRVVSVPKMELMMAEVMKMKQHVVLGLVKQFSVFSDFVVWFSLLAF